MSDSTGRYRINNIPADIFYIAAGFSDAPSFYPGTTDVAGAKTIATTTTTKVDTLDFVLTHPPGRACRERSSDVCKRFLTEGGLCPDEGPTYSSLDSAGLAFQKRLSRRTGRG